MVGGGGAAFITYFALYSSNAYSHFHFVNYKVREFVFRLSFLFSAIFMGGPGFELG